MKRKMAHRIANAAATLKELREAFRVSVDRSLSFWVLLIGSLSGSMLYILARETVTTGTVKDPMNWCFVVVLFLIGSTQDYLSLLSGLIIGLFSFALVMDLWFFQTI